MDTADIKNPDIPLWTALSWYAMSEAVRLISFNSVMEDSRCIYLGTSSHSGPDVCVRVRDRRIYVTNERPITCLGGEVLSHTLSSMINGWRCPTILSEDEPPPDLRSFLSPGRRTTGTSPGLISMICFCWVLS